MSEDNSKEKAPFQYIDKYPDAGGVFSAFLEDIHLVKNSFLVVLDTNTLLSPFSASPHSLEEIRKIYGMFKEQGRLIVPGHVAREFAENRTQKLQEIVQQLNRQKGIALSLGSSPILMIDDEYKRLLDKRKDIEGQIKDYKSLIDSMLKKIKSWRWDDPVSLIYRELFDESVIYDIEIDRKLLEQEIIFRTKNNIPPGYKDQSKSINSAGDYIIWKTILKLASERSLPVVFVTHDGKPDWWTQAEGSPLYPRFELIEEFRRSSSGMSFYIMKLSEIMELFDVKAEVVLEVARLENSNVKMTANIIDSQRRAKDSVMNFAFRHLIREKIDHEIYNGAIIADFSNQSLIIAPYIVQDVSGVFEDLHDLSYFYEEVILSKTRGKDSVKAIIAIFSNEQDAEYAYQENSIGGYPNYSYVGYAFPENNSFKLAYEDKNFEDNEIASFLWEMDLPF